LGLKPAIRGLFRRSALPRDARAGQAGPDSPPTKEIKTLTKEEQMKIIGNSAKLATLVTINKDLVLPNDDVVIEFSLRHGELRNITCGNLTLQKENEKFDFNGHNFNGHNFNGYNFNGYNFNGHDFNGWNFNGYNFNGWNFNGCDVSYYCFFNCTGTIVCASIEGRRQPHAEPVALEGIKQKKNK